MKKIVFAAVAAMSLVACGGGISQSADCKKYIECYESDSVKGTKGSLDSTYGTSGTCWSTGVQTTADACTATCKSGVETYHTTYPDEAKCK
ncbi:MAG: hypothetical protein QM765_07480 [Myxococcales bacterium]